MEFEITAYLAGQRPEVTKPDPTFFKEMKEEGIRKMVSRHYDLLRESTLKQMFSEDDSIFEAQKKNSADFMIQICGGPDYYNQNRGKPLLINRHAAFSITVEGRIIWLNCYKQALMEQDITNEVKYSFWNYLNVFSSWMVNTPRV
jgi:hemoglobin